MHPDWIRYSCQIALPGFNETAQEALQQARVLIAGAGGLGCPAAQYLVSSGVGTIGIADFDVVSVSNLHRQILYNPSNVDSNKAIVACEHLQRQNPGILLIPYTDQITSDNVLQIVKNYDVIIDCTDNFETRYLLNDAGVLTGKPVVYGAIYQFDGQVSVWNLPNANGSRSPNYRDLFPEVDATQIPGCSVGGVIPTLAGIIGCMQANEVIKIITRTGELLAGKVLIFDAQTMQSHIIKIGEATKTHITTLVNTAKVSTVTLAELEKGLLDNTLQLIDVRSLRERDADDIGGEHIPSDELEDRLELFRSSQKYVLYCATGKRSAEAVKIIKRHIPTAQVFSLQGGIAQVQKY